MEKAYLFCCLGPLAKYIRRMSWLSPTENVVTKLVTKNWVLNQMSPSMWLAHQLFESRLWSSYLCAWYDLSFVSVMSVGDWNSGIWHHCSQPKKHDYACAGIMLSLSVRVSRWTQVFAYRIRHVMTHFHWVSAMSIKLPRICSLFSLVNISLCSWHVAALLTAHFNELKINMGFFLIYVKMTGTFSTFP